MPRISPEQAGGRNVCAFLDTLAYAEIGRAMLDDPATDNGYRVLVGSLPGRLALLDDYTDHPLPTPNHAVQYAPGVWSTAAGRYQILSRYWDHYRRQLALPNFGPESQDRYAIQQIKEQRALEDLKAGRFDAAVSKCRNIWASLPGAGYGQREHRLDKLREIYLEAGGRLAPAADPDPQHPDPHWYDEVATQPTDAAEERCGTYHAGQRRRDG